MGLRVGREGGRAQLWWVSRSDRQAPVHESLGCDAGIVRLESARVIRGGWGCMYETAVWDIKAGARAPGGFPCKPGGWKHALALPAAKAIFHAYCTTAPATVCYPCM